MMSALVKLLLTPGLIAVATVLARRLGPGVGGAIVGLPLTSAPVSLFLALEQGPVFAATAAVGTLLGLLSQGALCLAYSWTVCRGPWWTRAGAGMAAFLGSLSLTRPPLHLVRHALDRRSESGFNAPSATGSAPGFAASVAGLEAFAEAFAEACPCRGHFEHAD